MSGENARHGLKAAFWTESFELKDHQIIPWNENNNFIVYIDDIINESFFYMRSFSTHGISQSGVFSFSIFWSIWGQSCLWLAHLVTNNKRDANVKFVNHTSRY